jgi:hypothetical protein
MRDSSGLIFREIMRVLGRRYVYFLIVSLCPSDMTRSF